MRVTISGMNSRLFPLALGAALLLGGEGRAVAQNDPFSQGVALAREGNCLQAVDFFNQVPPESPQSGLAIIDKAICLKAEGDTRNAFAALSQAEKSNDPKVKEAAEQLNEIWCFELADAAELLINDGKLDEARNLLAPVLEQDAAGVTKARDLMDRIEAEEPESRWEGLVTLGGGYDTNLARAELEQGQESGGFVELAGEVDYAAILEKDWTLRIGYDLFGQVVPKDFTQSSGTTTEEYSYQEHGLWAEAEHPDGDFLWGVKLRPYLSLVGMNPPALFLAGASIEPSIQYRSEFGLEVGGGLLGQWDSSLASAYDYLKGGTLGVEVWALYPLLSWMDISLHGFFENAWLGTLDVDNGTYTFKVPYSSMLMGGRVEADFSITDDLDLTIGGGLANLRFSDPIVRSDGDTKQRIDLMQRYSMNLVWWFYEPFWVEVRYLFEVNDSNIGDDTPGDYENKNYMRHLGAGALGVVF